MAKYLNNFNHDLSVLYGSFDIAQKSKSVLSLITQSFDNALIIRNYICDKKAIEHEGELVAFIVAELLRHQLITSEWILQYLSANNIKFSLQEKIVEAISKTVSQDDPKILEQLAFEIYDDSNCIAGITALKIIESRIELEILRVNDQISVITEKLSEEEVKSLEIEIDNLQIQITRIEQEIAQKLERITHLKSDSFRKNKIEKIENLNVVKINKEEKLNSIKKEINDRENKYFHNPTKSKLEQSTRSIDWINDYDASFHPMDMYTLNYPEYGVDGEDVGADW